MTFTRRNMIQALGASAVGALTGSAWAQAGAGLKISHQFPGGTQTEGDFRDRLCRKFAVEVEKRTAGALKASVYPGSSLMKTNAQFSSMRKGALDMSLVPLSYAGGEVAETNIGLMLASLEDRRRGQVVEQSDGRQGHRHRQLDLAGWRRGQPHASAADP